MKGMAFQFLGRTAASALARALLVAAALVLGARSGYA
jgi:hypothetical protein